MPECWTDICVLGDRGAEVVRMHERKIDGNNSSWKWTRTRGGFEEEFWMGYAGYGGIVDRREVGVLEDMGAEVVRMHQRKDKE